MKKDDDDFNRYKQFGLAALIPGMAHMIELMQRQLDDMRQQLAMMQEPARKVGRPAKGARLASGWPADAEERSREMRRRIANRLAKRKQRAAKRGVPDNSQVKKDHPDHGKFRETMRKSAKRRWANMSFKDRKARIAAMAAGKAAKKAKAEVPSVKMAVAS